MYVQIHAYINNLPCSVRYISPVKYSILFPARNWSLAALGIWKNSCFRLSPLLKKFPGQCSTRGQGRHQCRFTIVIPSQISRWLLYAHIPDSSLSSEPSNRYVQWIGRCNRVLVNISTFDVYLTFKPKGRDIAVNAMALLFAFDFLLLFKFGFNLRVTFEASNPESSSKRFVGQLFDVPKRPCKPVDCNPRFNRSCKSVV